MGITAFDFDYDFADKLSFVVKAADCSIRVQAVFSRAQSQSKRWKAKVREYTIEGPRAKMKLICLPHENGLSWHIQLQAGRANGVALELCILNMFLCSGGKLWSYGGSLPFGKNGDMKLFLVNGDQMEDLLRMLNESKYRVNVVWSSASSKESIMWRRNRFCHVRLHGINGIVSCWSGPTLGDPHDLNPVTDMFVALQHSIPTSSERDEVVAILDVIRCLKKIGARECLLNWSDCVVAQSIVKDE